MNLLELFLKKNSGEIARNRLKLLLVSERAGCSPELLELSLIHILYRLFLKLDRWLSEMEKRRDTNIV